MAFNSASSRGVLTSSFLDRSDEPPRYTGSPWLLLTSDVLLFFRSILYLPCIFLPLFPWDGGSSDELYPSFSNLRDLGLHFILFFVQLGFLISLPFSLYLPAWLLVLYITTVITVNALVCRLLNGGIPETGLTCTEDEVTATWEAHPDEYWIFLNGICVG